MQEIKRPPIMLTSSVIAYASGIKLIDTELRIKYALESLENWLKISPESHFVLCDGSNFNFAPLVKTKFPNCKIECLYFENDQEAVKNYGRGYGEGEIIKYAIEHSEYIKNANCFVKCTSKLWVANYEKILKHWNNKAAFKAVFKYEFSFVKKTILDYIDTRFYICSLDFYKNYLINSHQNHKIIKKESLEILFKNILDKDINNIILPLYPEILGMGGGSAVYYKIRWHKIIKEFLKIKITKNNNIFNNLYIN